MTIRADEVDPGSLVGWEEVLRIGRVDGPEVLQFSGIRAVEVEPPRGEVLVLDRRANEVRVFDTLGAHLRTIGRAGEGPGEFSGPHALEAARDTLMVSDRRGLHIYAMDGRHLDTRVLPSEGDIVFPGRVFAAEGGWGVEVQRVTRSGDNVVATYGLDPATGPVGESLFRHDYREDARTGVGSMGWIVAPLFSHTPVWTFDERGRTHVAPSPEYEIRVLNGDGRLVRIHRYDSRRVPVEQGMVDEFVAETESRCRGRPPESESCLYVQEALPVILDMEIPDLVPVVQRLLASDDGGLLVLRRDLDPHPFLSGDPSMYDLLGSDGAFVGRFEPPERFTPLWFDEDEIWGSQLGELDVPYVVKLRLLTPG